MKLQKIVDLRTALSDEAITKLLESQPAGDHLIYIEALPNSPQEELTLARAAAALANASGGFIVVGAQPVDGAPRAGGVGAGDPDGDARTVEQVIAGATFPPVDVYAAPARLSGERHLVVIEVPRSLDAPHQAGGTYPIREGAAIREMPAAEREHLERDRASDLRTLRDRARAVTLGDMADEAFIRGRLNGVRGAFLYVASIPAVLTGRGVEIELPPSRVEFRLAGEAPPAWVNSEGAYTVKAMSNLPARFAFTGREGDALFATRDLAAFRVDAGGTMAFGAKEIEKFVADTLRDNLPVLEILGYPGPFYAALVVKPDRPSRLATQAGNSPWIVPSAGTFDAGEPLFVDGVVPLAFHRRPPTEAATLPLVERLRALAGHTI